MIYRIKRGGPYSYKFAGSESEVFKQIGSGVAVQMVQWVGNEAIKYFNKIAV